KFTGVIFDGAHGPSPTLGSAPVFQTPHLPGWAKDGSFKDPRPDSIAPLPPPGPLPKDWGRYTGLFLNGNRTIFSYSIGKTAVLETMELEGEAFARTLHVGSPDGPVEVMVATASPDLHVDVVGSGANLVTQDNQVRVQLAAGAHEPFK